LGPSWVLRDLHGSEVTSSRGGKEQLFIVDQHASDEKFRFEAQPEID
jgi:DNA mismatch repair ATPase MutL